MSGKTLMATGKWAVGSWLTDTECIFVGPNLLCVFMVGMLMCVHARFVHSWGTFFLVLLYISFASHFRHDYPRSSRPVNQCCVPLPLRS